jgi:hypothetical protein
VKRRKPIPSQGHDEAPDPRSLKWVACRKCQRTRLRDKDWLLPCPPSAANAHERTYRGE